MKKAKKLYGKLEKINALVTEANEILKDIEEKEIPADAKAGVSFHLRGAKENTNKSLRSIEIMKKIISFYIE